MLLSGDCSNVPRVDGDENRVTQTAAPRDGATVQSLLKQNAELVKQNADFLTEIAAQRKLTERLVGIIEKSKL